MYPSNLLTWIISLVIFITGVFGLLFFFSSDSNKEHLENDGMVTVLTTIHPLYDITRQLAGDDMKVVRLLPPGASPHTFEMTPSLSRELERADVVFAIGHGLDTWIEQVAHSARKDVIFVDANIALRGYHEFASTEEAHEHEGEHESHGADDPHYWLSLENGKTIAQTITKTLITMDPTNRGGYEARLADFEASLATLQTERALNSFSLTKTPVITQHDGWWYFMEELGVNIVGSVESSGGVEATPRALVSLAELVKANNVRILVSEPQLSSAALRSFARDNNLITVELDPLGGVEGRETYQEMMSFNYQALVDAAQ